MAGSSTGSEAFAFISNGNLIVNGTGTLQVIDMLGHVLFTGEVNSSLFTLHSSLLTLHSPPACMSSASSTAPT